MARSLDGIRTATKVDVTGCFVDGEYAVRAHPWFYKRFEIGSQVETRSTDFGGQSPQRVAGVRAVRARGGYTIGLMGQTVSYAILKDNGRSVQRGASFQKGVTSEVRVRTDSDGVADRLVPREG